MRWKSRIPGSRHVALAEAGLLRQRAWDARGGGYANTVSAETWKLFEDLHQQAERVLLDAPSASRELPAWHSMMIQVSQDLTYPKHSTVSLLEKAAAKWPNYYHFFELVATRYQPIWGGSWRKVESFAADWSRRYAEQYGEGDTLYARIYVRLRNFDSFAEMSPDWNKLKKGLEEIVLRFPKSIEYRNYLASFACAARDKSAYVKAMAALERGDVKPNEWIKGHKPEACNAWAYEKS